MKVVFKILLFIGIFSLISCKKDYINSNNTPDPQVPPANVAPKADAGSDIRLEIPTTHTRLSGTAFDVNNNYLANNNILESTWRKISGPDSYFLEFPGNFTPKLFWLEEGVYEFELSVTIKTGLTGKDTVRVTVFSNDKKHVITDLPTSASGFYISQIPAIVKDNLKWVFAKSENRSEQATAGPLPGIDYNWGGYYYEILSGDTISVYGVYSGKKDITIYY